MFRQVEIGRRGCGDQIPAAPLERILLDQVVQDLLDEQGIPSRGGTDRGR
jgi:hypothetical protein